MAYVNLVSSSRDNTVRGCGEIAVFTKAGSGVLYGDRFPRINRMLVPTKVLCSSQLRNRVIFDSRDISEKKKRHSIHSATNDIDK